MNIRQKILIYFSILSISLIGLTFVLIYILFSNYRREEFQQRIKDKTTTTLKFLAEVQQIDHDLLQIMDQHTINNLDREKVLIFDNTKKLVYASLDDTKIIYPGDILKRLGPKNPVIEFEENGFDVVGVYFVYKENNYYGIAKAYDIFGLAKQAYLRYVLIFLFIIISTLILISSFLLARQITFPINRMGAELKKINFETEKSFITVPESRDEIFLLATRFNELMKRLNDSFAFQKHAVNHISHELKTPIAILVSNFEKIEKQTDIKEVQQLIRNQKEDTRSLSDIINALLEISKVESGIKIHKEEIRIDELIFDEIANLKILNENFRFDVKINSSIENEQGLTVSGNKKLISLALVNLLINCIKYSSNQKAKIKVGNLGNKMIIEFSNEGKEISDSELQFIFRHFFRGDNSKGKRGFGLGLVLINKIIKLHNGQLAYKKPNGNINIFRIILPLGLR